MLGVEMQTEKLEGIAGCETDLTNKTVVSSLQELENILARLGQAVHVLPPPAVTHKFVAVVTLAV